MDTQKPPQTRFSFYENFDGHYHKVGEIRDLIPQFKAFYYAQKREDPAKSAVAIINAFNGQITPFTFFPWEKQYKLWRKKWDAELLAEQGFKEERKRVREIVHLRDEREVVIIPDNESLDAGARTLAGELLNDAMGILKHDQGNEEAYEDDVIVKRRAYVLNVFNYVTKSVHGTESLRLKSNAEKRENAGFLMDLLAHATAGKMTDDDLETLKLSITPHEDASRQSV
jgi:hypothetical protein